MNESSSETFDLHGATLSYPTFFRDGHSAMGLFAVPAGPADRILADTPFSAARIAPGLTACSLVCVHYSDTDCGEYLEIAVAFFVDPFRSGDRLRIPYLSTWRDVLSGEIASHTWLLPVSTELARDAGIFMWGFPKHIAELDHEQLPETANFTWIEDGELVLRFSMPTGGHRNQPEISPPVYSLLDGRPVASRLTQRYSGVAHHVGGGSLELGTHPTADRLRALGLPKRPVVATWNGHLSFEMSAPESLD